MGIKLAIKQAVHHLLSHTIAVTFYWSPAVGGRHLCLSRISACAHQHEMLLHKSSLFFRLAALKGVNSSFSATCCLMQHNMTEGWKYFTAAVLFIVRETLVIKGFQP